MEEKLMVEIKKMLKAANKRILLQYDTTFNLTGYYASILNLMHPFLINAVTKKPPPIPIAVYFHELKSEKVHRHFWRWIQDEYPELDEKCCMITDCEKAIRNSISSCFPNMPLFRCWNHLWSSTERWIRSNGGDDSTVGFYIDSLRELFLQSSKSAYEKLLELKKKGQLNRTKNPNSSYLS